MNEAKTRRRTPNRSISRQDRFNELEATIQRLEASLSEIEARAKAAVQAEQAEALAGIWAEKKSVASELDAARREREGLRGELQKTMISDLSTLFDEDDASMARLRSEYEQAIESAQDLLRGLGDVFGKLQQALEVLLQEHQRWQLQITALFDESPAALLLRATPVHSASRDGRLRDAPSTRPWMVYDCDLGKTVETFEELRNLVVRWYPRLSSERERIEYFLRQPEAASMPLRLRHELASQGYVLPTIEPAILLQT